MHFIGINPELLQFLCLTIYIGDWYFFRYGHVRLDTNINPQVPVFYINCEPVPAPNG